MVAFVFSLIFWIIGLVAWLILFFIKNTDQERVYIRKSDGKLFHSEPYDYYAEKYDIKTEENITYPGRKWSTIPLAFGAVLCVVLLLVSILVTVPTGHTGVLTTFGNVEEQTLDSGMHSKKPWQKVVCMDNRVQKETVELSCFSKDIQEVEIKYTINYQIDKENAQNIYRTIGVDYYDLVVKPSIAEAVKVVTARYTAENLVSTRADLAEEIEQLLEESLYNYNVKVVSTAIEDMDFTDEFTSAVEAKQVAVQNKLKAQTEQEQKTMEAEQQAERSKIEANAQAEVSKIQANADKDVAQIGADSAEYQGRKEASIAMQRLASINGWTVLTTDDGLNEIYKADGTKVTSEELAIGAQKLMNYYYIQQWDGVLPETIAGEDNVLALIGLK